MAEIKPDAAAGKPGLRLNPIEGPPLQIVEVEFEQAVRVGRSRDCELVLNDPGVSRWHAQIRWPSGLPSIEDLGSSHGTFVNGRRLSPHEPEPLSDGDWITIGPWVFEVAWRTLAPTTWIHTQPDTVGVSGSQSVVPIGSGSDLPSSLLRALLELVDQVSTAGSHHELGTAVAASLVRDGRWTRAALLRSSQGMQQAELVAVHPAHEPASSLPVSRTLIGAALESSEAVALSSRSELRHAASLASQNVADVVCVPVPVDGTATYLLYAVQESAREAQLTSPLAYILAAARACRIGLEALRRRQREEFHRTIEQDLAGARAVQQHLLPPPMGRVGPIEYAFVNIPGRFLSGDLVDVIAIDAHRTALVVGDVEGKGPAAAVLMASVMMQIRTSLLLGQSAAATMCEVNTRLVQRADGCRIVTLWFGVVDERAGELRVVDAGHGLWVVDGQDPSPEEALQHRTFPLGVTEHSDFRELTVPLRDGSTILVVTDGVSECRSASGGMFGLEPIRRAVKVDSLELAAQEIIDAARSHAGSESLHDDATVLAIRRTTR